MMFLRVFRGGSCPLFAVQARSPEELQARRASRATITGCRAVITGRAAITGYRAVITDYARITGCRAVITGRATIAGRAATTLRRVRPGRGVRPRRRVRPAAACTRGYRVVPFDDTQARRVSRSA
jgi:hypothetical protein